jgi:hypothetical protein
MFKIGSSQNEIFENMEKSLIANQNQESNGFNRLLRAAERLNSAATIFKNAGMHSESKAIQNIILDIVKELKAKQ